jgi:hypothetical protein
VNYFKRILITTACVVVFIIVTSFAAPNNGKLTIRFNNYAGNSVLNLDSTYKNQLGQPFKVTNVKYYISNIVLRKYGEGPRGVVPNYDYVSIKEYYLINEMDEDSKQINLNVPIGTYDDMTFIIGVDSLHNCSGIQEGALDPINGMFWAWNTGYIFLKFDGTSPLSKSNGRILEYHIGGYRSPNNCIRKVTLRLNHSIQINSSTSINIKADILQLFKSPTPMDFSKLSSVVDFHNATTIADNYAGMFSLIEK